MTRDGTAEPSSSSDERSVASPAPDAAGPSEPDGVGPPDPDAVPDVDVLVVDNYDSFAYNILQYVGELAGEVTVRRNDAVDLADVRALDPDAVVLSPGPGRPADAGVSTALFGETDLPILGVCLGHQALCAARGATVERAPTVVHGKPSTVEHDGRGLFAGLPEHLRVGRYHSLSVGRDALPDDLVETAWTVGGDAEDGPEPPESQADDERSIVMGVRHRERPHVGVQFHPESILTGEVDGEEASLVVGKRLIARFCELVASYDGDDGGPLVDVPGDADRSSADPAGDADRSSVDPAGDAERSLADAPRDPEPAPEEVEDP